MRILNSLSFYLGCLMHSNLSLTSLSSLALSLYIAFTFYTRFSSFFPSYSLTLSFTLLSTFSLALLSSCFIANIAFSSYLSIPLTSFELICCTCSCIACIFAMWLFRSFFSAAALAEISFSYITVSPTMSSTYRLSLS